MGCWWIFFVTAWPLCETKRRCRQHVTTYLLSVGSFRVRTTSFPPRCLYACRAEPRVCRSTPSACSGLCLWPERSPLRCINSWANPRLRESSSSRRDEPARTRQPFPLPPPELVLRVGAAPADAAASLPVRAVHGVGGVELAAAPGAVRQTCVETGR